MFWGGGHTFLQLIKVSRKLQRWGTLAPFSECPKAFANFRVIIVTCNDGYVMNRLWQT